MLGPFAYSSARFALMSVARQRAILLADLMNDRGLFEPGVGVSRSSACSSSYLHWRGWKPADFKIEINWKKR